MGFIWPPPLSAPAALRPAAGQPWGQGGRATWHLATYAQGVSSTARRCVATAAPSKLRSRAGNLTRAARQRVPPARPPRLHCRTCQPLRSSRMGIGCDVQRVVGAGAQRGAFRARPAQPPWAAAPRSRPARPRFAWPCLPLRHAQGRQRQSSAGGVACVRGPGRQQHSAHPPPLLPRRAQRAAPRRLAPVTGQKRAGRALLGSGLHRLPAPG